MQIPRDIIERITREADIVEIISESVPLKKAGTNYKGLCPFHGEKSPSFTVTPHKGIFYCFGCNEGGDVISFLMKHEKLEFIEAVERLAKRLGITLPKSEDKRIGDANDVYYKINAYALWFFREELKKSEAARAYLRERGISDETLNSFELGFAPDGFENLLQFFNAKKIPLDKALALGLLRRHPERGTFYDFFRNRVMFPIRDRQGRVIGFGGRTLSSKPDEAKYVNSPESPVYHKSSELYGLHRNKKMISGERRAVVVEGYIDVVACAQLGCDTAVAPLGTSFTNEQAKALARFADDIVLLFDGDQAGQKAAAKAFATVLESGRHPRIASLAGAKDPGDLLKASDGATVLSKAIHGAPAAMDWLFAETASRTGSSPGEQAKSLNLLSNWISRLPDPSEQALYKDRLRRHFDTIPAQLNKDIEKAQETVRDNRLQRGLDREELVVLAYWVRPERFAPGEFASLVNGFNDTTLRELATFLEDFYTKREPFAGWPSISGVPNGLGATLSRILACADDYPEPNDLLFQQQHRAAQRHRLKNVTAHLLKVAGDDEASLRLLQEKQKMLTAWRDNGGNEGNEK